VIRLFIDFDGTMTVNDVGDEVFFAFADFRGAASNLSQGTYSVADYYRHVVRTMKSSCTPEVFRAFIEKQDADPGLLSLVQFCAQNNIELTVVSDGFDAYIEPILSREGVADLPVVSNTLSYENGTWLASFPGATDGCTCFCASCKRNTVVSMSGDDDVVVYVGDGASDECAAEHSDVVFAKHGLAAYCTAHRIPHHPYTTLNDVKRILATKMAAGELRQRRQAVLARRAAFTGE